MERLRRTIRFTGKNLNDVFCLSCVKMIMKTERDEPILVLRPEKMRKSADACRCCAEIGDRLTEYDNGEWEVQR